MNIYTDLNAEHTLFYCIRWNETRETYLRETGKIFNTTSLTEDLITSKERSIYKNKDGDPRYPNEKEER